MPTAMDILSSILKRKEADVEKARSVISLREMQARAETAPQPRSFLTRFTGEKRDTVNIIAEVKRASPSKGPICPDLDPDRCRRVRAGDPDASALGPPNAFRGPGLR